MMGFTGLTVTLLFPIAVLFLMIKHFPNFDSRNIKSRFGSLYEGLITSNHQIIIFRFWFIVRRLTLALNVVFVKDLIKQICIWFIQQIISLAIIGHGEPFESKSNFRDQLVNEVFIQFTIYHVMLFSPYIDNIDI